MEKPAGIQSWLDPMSLPPRLGSIYPAPFGDKLAGREKRALGDALQLTQFGVNLVTLAPAWSMVLSAALARKRGRVHLCPARGGDATSPTPGRRPLRRGWLQAFPQARPMGIISSIKALNPRSI